MRLNKIQAILLTGFILSGVLLVINQSVEATELALPHTEMGTQEPMDLYGPDVHITLPWIHLERSIVEGFLLVLVMVGTMSGFVGSLVISKDR